MGLLLTLPLIIPLGSAVFLFAFSRYNRLSNLIYVGSSLLQFILAIFLLDRVLNEGIQVVSIGNWPAPFGIPLVADLFSALMLIVSTLVGLAVSLFAWGWGLTAKENKLGYPPLAQLLMMGVAGSFLTGDLFNLYVCFEIMLMSSFVLMTLEKKQSRLIGGIKYVTLNIISSALFLAGLGLLYGNMGTLNIADLSQKIQSIEDFRFLAMPILFISIAFGVKSGLFPLFFWLPASYPSLPPALVALFGGLLTKVGVYALIRMWTTIFLDMQHILGPWLIVIACLTMVTGVLGAVAQYEIRYLLSFHIISQIGYMVLGLAFFTTTSVAAAIFYTLHNMLAKTNLFLIGGTIQNYQKTSQLKKIGGMLKVSPFLAVIFLISALGLAGIPPLSGFFAKFFLIREIFAGQGFWSGAIALAVSILTLFSMIKIWNEAFWKKAPEQESSKAILHQTMSKKLLFSNSILAIGVVLMGLGAGKVWRWTYQAAESLMDRQQYIERVLVSAKVKSPVAVVRSDSVVTQ